VTLAEIEERYVSLDEAAAMLRIHPSSFRKLILRGTFPRPFQTAGRYFVDRAQVEAFKTTYNPRPGRKPARRLI
jgi:predicted DNA-binding transcriptional regulator AlpA